KRHDVKYSDVLVGEARDCKPADSANAAHVGRGRFATGNQTPGLYRSAKRATVCVPAHSPASETRISERTAHSEASIPRLVSVRRRSVTYAQVSCGLSLMSDQSKEGLTVRCINRSEPSQASLRHA